MAGSALFYHIGSEQALLEQMIERIGPLPRHWHSLVDLPGLKTKGVFPSQTKYIPVFLTIRLGDRWLETRFETEGMLMYYKKITRHGSGRRGIAACRLCILSVHST